MGVGAENEKIFDSLAWWLHRRGLRPNHISVLQVPVYAAMIWVGLRAGDASYRWGFLGLQILAMIVDGADGILARRTGTVTRRGHLVDELFDIVGIGITIWVVSVHFPHHDRWLLALLIANFLVYIQNEIQGTKNITYTRGPLTVGFVLDLYYVGIVFIGIALPLFIGLVLLFTRVSWRKRFWTYYEFLTAGLRQEYKATPRRERVARHADDPRLSARAQPRAADRSGSADSDADEDTTASPESSSDPRNP